jgi:tripartite-type tricarboxylate transporter receptor subunit TctC
MLTCSRLPVMAAALATVVAGALAPALAQDWPSRPIRILVGFGPGGGTDIVARIVAQPLSDLLGQPVVVENKVGAGGALATDTLTKAAKDGTTAAMLSGGHSVSAVMYKTLPYDSLKDLQMVSLVGTAALGVVVHKDDPAADLAALIARAKSAPGKLNYATVGVGSTQHFAAELFRQLAGVDIQHIPYRGTPAAVTAVRARDVDLLFETVQAVLGQVNAGDLKVLAVTTKGRWPVLPSVASAAEQGVAGYEVMTWYGLVLPAGTPAPIVEKFSKAVGEVLSRGSVRKQIADAGAVATASTPQEMAAYVEAEIAKWRAVRDKAGIQPQ